ncbi:MAG: FAD-dependent oxidoreductase [Anaerolineae bacterium]
MADNGYQPDVLIVGGGVIGVCTAYYLAKQGIGVTLVERDEICAGSSYGNVGWIANGHAIPIAAPGVLTQGLKWLLDSGSPFYIKPRLNGALLRWLWQFQAACTDAHVRQSIPVLLALSQHSLELFEEIITAEALACDFERKGLLHLFTTADSFKKDVKEAKLLQQFGVESTELDADGVRDIEPNVLPAIRHGVYFPEYAHLNPHHFVLGLADAARSHGAALLPKTEVLTFETGGRKITTVHTTRGSFRPRQVVLAAGAWSPLVSRELGLSLPVQPAKGYSITVHAPPTGPLLPLSLIEHKVAVTPLGNLLRFSSTLELAGYDFSINQRRVAATRKAVQLYLPNLDAPEVLELWRGFRPASPDGLPIIGPAPGVENLMLATGHGMLGITHGPVTGKLITQLLAGERPLFDIGPLRPERF